MKITNLEREIASNAANPAMQSEYIAIIGNRARGRKHHDVLRLLCSIAMDEATIVENRWYAYILALHVAGIAFTSLPITVPGTDFRVPEDFDQQFIARWTRD